MSVCIGRPAAVDTCMARRGCGAPSGSEQQVDRDRPHFNGPYRRATAQHNQRCRNCGSEQRAGSSDVRHNRCAHEGHPGSRFDSERELIIASLGGTQTSHLSGFHCSRVGCACSAGTVGSFSNKPLSPNESHPYVSKQVTYSLNICMHASGTRTSLPCSPQGCTIPPRA